MRRGLVAAGIIMSVMAAFPVFAGDIVVPMNLVNDQGVGQAIGTITISEGPHGLVFTPNVSGLAPGMHGFHVHQNPDCGPGMKDGKSVPGLAAGGHYDPANTGKHEGPLGKGHLGDLPVLTVGADGKATTAVTAPRLKMADVKGRSLMIHAGGDNYSDQPAPLGGGGARVACGVIK
jgi:Cu-Zn family superoxide dismutase